MFELKRLSKEGVGPALRKAERYRLLNEPWEAESICRDVLEVDPDNHDALITLILALTDQFESDSRAEVAWARDLLPRITDPYGREYYAGIICERWAKRLLRHDTPGGGPLVHDWLHRAMAHYRRAEELRQPGDDDAILRWNTCARIIERHPHIRPSERYPESPIESE